jgi:hypothetical protein
MVYKTNKPLIKCLHEDTICELVDTNDVEQLNRSCGILSNKVRFHHLLLIRTM